MTIEQMIANEVQGTESGKKLFKMLSNIFSNKENIENVILLLETEENRQKMIKFLEKKRRIVDEVHYYIVEIDKNNNKLFL